MSGLVVDFLGADTEPQPPMFTLDGSKLPADVVPLLVEHLDERRDLFSAALVNRSFNYAATRHLYQSIQPRGLRVHGRIRIIHPAQTLLAKPHLAHFVLRYHEMGDQYVEAMDAATVISQALDSLALCTNLREYMLTGSRPIGEDVFLSFFEALRGHKNLRSLTVRTPGPITEPVWSLMTKFTDLTSVSIWCMEGPPRFLQGWSPTLAPTLTHLELGRAAGVPATLLISSLSALTRLESLRIRGMQGAAMPTLLSRLPSLRILDTDANLGGPSRWHPTIPAPRLRELTIRASSISTDDAQKLWEWITRLIPASSFSDRKVEGTNSDDEYEDVPDLHAAASQIGSGYGLESFTLYAGTITFSTLFTTYLHAYHRNSLRRLILGSAQVINLSHVCHSFSLLEEFECSVVISNAREIAEALSKFPNIRAAWLYPDWVPASASKLMTDDDRATPGPDELEPPEQNTERLKSPQPPTRTKPDGRFDLDDARLIMIGDEERPAYAPNLRELSVGSSVYGARWVLDHSTGKPKFEVYRQVDEKT